MDGSNFVNWENVETTSKNPHNFQKNENLRRFCCARSLCAERPPAERSHEEERHTYSLGRNIASKNRRKELGESEEVSNWRRKRVFSPLFPVYIFFAMRPILLKGHERPLTFLKYNRDGDLLFSCAKDHTPNVWYAHNGERVGTYKGHNGAVWCCDVSSMSYSFLLSLDVCVDMCVFMKIYLHGDRSA